MTRIARTTYATMSPDLMEVWRRFGEKGELTLPGLTHKEAVSMVRQLNIHRLRLQEAAHAGDDLAIEHHGWASDAYITVEEESVGIGGTNYAVILKIHPLKRALWAQTKKGY